MQNAALTEYLQLWFHETQTLNLEERIRQRGLLDGPHNITKNISLGNTDYKQVLRNADKFKTKDRWGKYLTTKRRLTCKTKAREREFSQAYGRTISDHPDYI